MASDDFDCSGMEYDSTDITDPYSTSLEVEINYHREHYTFYSTLLEIYKKGGKRAADCYKREHLSDLPKKPRATISGQNKGIGTLQGAELLNELKKLLCLPKDNGEMLPFDEGETDVERIKNIIVQGQRSLNFKQMSVIKDAVILGRWLDRLAQLYYKKFNSFVKDNITFGLSWVRKLRALSRVFHTYKKLQNLNISLTMATQITSKVERAIEGLSN